MGRVDDLTQPRALLTPDSDVVLRDIPGRGRTRLLTEPDGATPLDPSTLDARATIAYQGLDLTKGRHGGVPRRGHC